MKSRKEVGCKICGKMFTVNNIEKHLHAHENHPKRYLKKYALTHDGLICQFCKKELKNRRSLVQHECTCKNNPNRRITPFMNEDEHGNNIPKRSAWNKGLSKETSDVLKHKAEIQSKTTKNRPGHKHTDAEKQNLREHALKNGFGGFNMHKKTIFVDGIAVDSSYEKIVAESLTENNIEWKRCIRFKYIDDKNKLHHYTPDFYLPAYDVYLDPKNDFLINNINPILKFRDVDKIRWVMEQNNIRVIILDKEHLTYEKIVCLITENI